MFNSKPNKVNLITCIKSVTHQRIFQTSKNTKTKLSPSLALYYSFISIWFSIVKPLICMICVFSLACVCFFQLDITNSNKNSAASKYCTLPRNNDPVDAMRRRPLSMTGILYTFLPSFFQAVWGLIQHHLADLGDSFQSSRSAH